ncbi:thermonuclease family protein [Nonomuraea sp. NPDC048826]|uniref:thermonuclease family protein n=1 Tax=Nonomuraea sp. NPDC048826 TaxID=3364347 RepID=UPI0037180E51
MRIRSLAGTVTALTAILSMAAPASATTSAAVPPKGAVAAKVVKIVDGDTIDVMRKGVRLRVRLLEVDTPERGQCWFRTATRRTAALLPLGKTAYLLRDKDPKDRYGRLLYYVWNAKGVHVNRNLVRYGYGKAVLYKPNDRYIKIMRAEQRKAQKERLRIWSGKCDKGAAPTETATPTPTSGGTDPRFRTCGAANAAGYGPYRRGRDPEYAWYQDRDGDGLVCER